MTDSIGRTELVRRVAAARGIPQATVAAVLAGIEAEILTAVRAGTRVTLAKFGAFERRDRAERTGHNPRTGEAITIAAHSTLAFRASPEARA